MYKLTFFLNNSYQDSVICFSVQKKKLKEDFQNDGHASHIICSEGVLLFFDIVVAMIPSTKFRVNALLC